MGKKILKRSLALGALMAFVITGSAWAEAYPSYTDYEGPNYVGKSKETETDKYIYGGAIKATTSLKKENTSFVGNTVENKHTGSSKYKAYGGAVWVQGDLEIKNCYFEGNKVVAGYATQAYGGAISQQEGILKISNTYFIDNSTSSYKNGSAIYASASRHGSFIASCVFDGNVSGAPVWITGNSTDIEVKDSTFLNNNGSIQVEAMEAKVTLTGSNTFEDNTAIGASDRTKMAIYSKGKLVFAKDSYTLLRNNAGDIGNFYEKDKNGDVVQNGRVTVEPGAIVESHSGIDSTGGFELNGTLKVGADSNFTNLSGTNGTFEFLTEDIKVEVTNNTTTGMEFVANGTVNDAVNGNIEELIGDDFAGNDSGATFKLDRGSVAGEVDGTLVKDETTGMYVVEFFDEKPHEGNAAISHNANIAMMAWRAETNDMNKRLGELRNANGDLGIWARMVGGEDEFKSVEYEYTQYQLGYDEKLSVDPSWTVGVALSYTDGESKFTDGSGENTHKGLSVYGSKLNDDGSFIDLIAKYSRLEHDLTTNSDKGDYSTNGYSVSAEYGKRFQQGKGLWIEPQVELTYGKVKSAEYKLGDKTVSQDAMESLVGRVGFSLGKDIKQGNVYARASYLYDFEGETNMAFANSGARREFKYDLGGGWWEVGVGANINLSKATYIYADVEKTFGGEVDTNWQWNLGVRYSF